MNFQKGLQVILEIENYKIDWSLALVIVLTVSIFYILIDIFSFESKILKILKKDGLD